MYTFYEPAVSVLMGFDCYINYVSHQPRKQKQLFPIKGYGIFDTSQNQEIFLFGLIKQNKLHFTLEEILQSVCKTNQTSTEEGFLYRFKIFFYNFRLVWFSCLQQFEKFAVKIKSQASITGCIQWHRFQEAPTKV